MPILDMLLERETEATAVRMEALGNKASPYQRKRGWWISSAEFSDGLHEVSFYLMDNGEFQFPANEDWLKSRIPFQKSIRSDREWLEVDQEQHPEEVFNSNRCGLTRQMCRKRGLEEKLLFQILFQCDALEV